MISKKYRLKEREVKKALTRGKPFFGYAIVLNVAKNNIYYDRLAIVVGSKSVNTNVERNFFRRKFYDFLSSKDFLKNNLKEKTGNDYVFVIKKKTKLDKKQQKSINEFEQNLNFLIKNKGKKY